MWKIIHYITGNPIVSVSRILGMCMLIILSVIDVKSKKIPASILMVSGLMAVLYIFSGSIPWRLQIEGLIVGVVFLIISKVTREGIGYGDSLLFCVLGVYLGIWKLLELLAVTWIFAAITAMGMTVRKRWHRKSSFPLIPWITVGYLSMWISEVWT